MTATSLGQRRQLVRLQNPGASVPDGDGGSTQGWAPLVPPSVYAAFETPTARDLERLAAGTVISTAAVVLKFPFHPDVTTATRAQWTDPAGRSHTASVVGVETPEGRCDDTVCLCVELLNAPAPVPDPSWVQTGWLQ